MNSYVENLIKKHQNQFQTVLDELVVPLSGESDAEFNQEFLSGCINTLTDHNALVISEEHDPDFLTLPEGFHELYVRGKKGNSGYGVDGYFFNNDQGSLVLSLFIVDDVISPEIQEIPTADVNSKLSYLYSFFFFSAVGYIQSKCSQDSAEYELAEAIRSNLNSIRSLKIYMVTPRILGAPVKYQRSSKREQQLGIEYEFSQMCMDLPYFASIMTGEGAVDLNLYGIGGIDALRIPTANTSYSCYLTYLTGDVVVELYSLYGTSLVQANVRAYLGKNKVNEGIRMTIQEEPNDFLAFNNGLVVFAENAEILDGRIMKIENLQIVNGGQTCASIYSTWLTANNTRGKYKDKKNEIHRNIRAIQIPVKLIVFPSGCSDDELQELQRKVSVAANSQNTIKVSDLSSKLPFHLRFKVVSAGLVSAQNSTHWFYENLRGSYGAELQKLVGKKNESAMFQERYPKSQVVTKSDIAVASLSFDRDSCSAAKGAETSVQIFNEKVKDVVDLSPEEVSKYICQHIIFKQLTEVMKARKKELNIPNPRIPIIYAIRLFQKEFSHLLDYKEVWELQRLPSNLQQLLVEIVIRCNETIRLHMGSSMISQYGKRRECERIVDSYVITRDLMSHFH
jgi:hypothetical protein